MGVLCRTRWEDVGYPASRARMSHARLRPVRRHSGGSDETFLVAEGRRRERRKWRGPRGRRDRVSEWMVRVDVADGAQERGVLPKPRRDRSHTRPRWKDEDRNRGRKRSPQLKQR